jgi:hypothetical protein
MKSNTNEVFLQLVKDIVYWGNIEEEEICVRVGRNPGYISQTKSRIKAGISVPESFVNLLKLEFKEELKRKTEGAAIVKDMPVKTLTYILRILAKVNILFSNEAQKIATMTGQDPQEVLDRMNGDATEEASSLFDELYKRQ